MRKRSLRTAALAALLACCHSAPPVRVGATSARVTSTRSVDLIGNYTARHVIQVWNDEKQVDEPSEFVDCMTIGTSPRAAGISLLLGFDNGHLCTFDSVIDSMDEGGLWARLTDPECLRDESKCPHGCRVRILVRDKEIVVDHDEPEGCTHAECGARGWLGNQVFQRSSRISSIDSCDPERG
jgi:hypothetical protein